MQVKYDGMLATHTICALETCVQTMDNYLKPDPLTFRILCALRGFIMPTIVTHWHVTFASQYGGEACYLTGLGFT